MVRIYKLIPFTGLITTRRFFLFLECAALNRPAHIEKHNFLPEAQSAYCKNNYIYTVLNKVSNDLILSKVAGKGNRF